MLLELGKAGSFALCLLSLYGVLMSAFFEPNTTWEHRLWAGAIRMGIAAGVSLVSGMLFAFPVKTNPDGGMPLWETLPVRVFLGAAVGMAVLFGLTWYLRCGGVNSFGVKSDCF